MKLINFFNSITRKKRFTDDLSRSDLKKVLGLSDLTFLSFGSMVGSGLYVLTGSVARDIAGPSIVISYILAAIASVLSAVCYAEFAARIPITGSAYQFVYLSIGEIWAFMIGWNVFVEHVVLAASIAKGWSGYVDALTNYQISNVTTQFLPIVESDLLSPYPDFLAGAMVIFMTIVVVSGVKLSSKVNIFFAVVNCLVIIFIIGTGLAYADIRNWTGTMENGATNATTAESTFFPFGWSGTFRGAATLIFSYVGYEVVAAATEEAAMPKKDVPLSLVISLSVVVFGYVGSSAALTLMVPWDTIQVASPFPSAFNARGLNWAKYVISVGALAAMTAALLSALLVVPRYLYAMARDGLLMSLFENVNQTTKVPVLSSIIVGIFCFLLSIIFNITTLVELISIGQLLACTFVSICVIKLRYEPNDISRYETLLEEGSQESFETADSIQLPAVSKPNNFEKHHEKHNEETPLSSAGPNSTNNLKISPTSTSDIVECNCGTIKRIFLQPKLKPLFQWTSTYYPGTVPYYSLLISIFFSSIATVMLLFGYQKISEAWFLFVLLVFIIISILSLVFISFFNEDQSIVTYKVPFVPYIPFASIIVNIALIFNLNPLTWIRFTGWMIIGMIVYFGYSFKHSKVAKVE